MIRRLFPALVFLSTALGAARAAATPELEFFEKSIRPVLAEQCYKCHGAEKQKAELRLDSRAAVLKGTDLGPVAVPGKPEESSLIKSLRHEGDSKMPEKADKLPDEQIAAFTEWVKMGLPWPEADPVKVSAKEEAARSHWAFQPVKKPAVALTGEVKSPVDALISTKREAAGYQAAPPAPRRTLLRRASFDLTGLPPTAEEAEAFETDESPDAFARVVDRLLASPAYGERWGRYWLDVARYADTKGYVFQEERAYAFAYTYRDWVIRALNADMPYDQFLIRQIAADHLEEKSNEHLAALGFLTLGRRFLSNIHDIIDDRIDVVSRGTMGLTTTCARCHDHKFDPISQKDYYALYGVFASSMEPDAKDLPVLAGSEPSPGYVQERATCEAEIEAFYTRRGMELGWTLAALQGGMPAFVPGEAMKEFRRAKFFSVKANDEVRELRNKLARVEVSPQAPPRAMALVDKPQPVPSHLFKRGNPNAPGEVVPRRFLTVLSGGEPKPFTKGSGRLELARAIASEANPLTARVMVNRIWARHFGAGLVRTPGDFGVKGEPPTHPELLDWLAATFMESGWSMKKLHRTILLSATYQQSSEGDPRAQQADPENRLLTRMSRRRLDFEALRDALLAASGQLDTTVGGRAVDITKEPFTNRRSVYAYIDRQNLPGVFRTFDFASPDTTSPQRHVTTVPQQALFMMNNPFVMEQAKALVAAPAFAAAPPGEAEVQHLYRRLFSRRAEPVEVSAGLAYLAVQMAQKPETPVPLDAWERYAHVLLATNEFAFVD